MGATHNVTAQGGVVAAVTRVKVVDPATLANPATNILPAGDRLVAVQLPVAQSSPPQAAWLVANDALLFDSQGQQYASWNVQAETSVAAGCPQFPVREQVYAGQPSLGCVSFDVPSGVRVTGVEFAPDGGVAAGVRWTLLTWHLSSTAPAREIAEAIRVTLVAVRKMAAS